MPELTEQLNDAQRRFDSAYITSAEIAKDLDVSRVSVLRARERKLLPDAIVVGDKLVCVWERATIKPYLDAWRITLSARRRRA